MEIFGASKDADGFEEFELESGEIGSSTIEAG